VNQKKKLSRLGMLVIVYDGGNFGIFAFEKYLNNHKFGIHHDNGSVDLSKKLAIVFLVVKTGTQLEHQMRS
jgi:hypothetical protein